MSSTGTPIRHSEQTIIDWIRCAPTQWSLRLSKPDGFRFVPGHYVKLGLPETDGGEIIWRPYSVVSAPHETHLEFLLTVVPTGTLTSRLANMDRGETVLLDPTAMGFFVEDQLAPGAELWMLATGSGLGPYISMLREGSTFKRHTSIVVVHSVRTTDELAYADELRALAARYPGALHYVPVVTREAGSTLLAQRIPTLIGDGTLEAHVGLPLDPARARAMVCGNPQFTADMRALLRERQFQPCRRGLIGSMLFENYWQ